ncbi:MAG: phosphoribosylglycinamide formyltransferase 2, partial [Leptospiraceae bacterium]|nr:phosphoribosylglycinamide formyltransferase 2 [Leptospiraceae bacterium]
PSFTGLNRALSDADVQLRLFGKPEIHGNRRMGVVLARGSTIQEARERAARAAESIELLEHA